MKEIIDGLKEYGATLNNEGFIQKGNKTLSVRFVIVKNRLRAEGAGGVLIASFPIKKSSVKAFVEKFWYWEKVKK